VGKKLKFRCSCGTKIKLPVEHVPIGGPPSCPAGSGEGHEVKPVMALARRKESSLERKKRKRAGGLVAIGDMESAVADLFKPDLMLPGRALVDEDGNVLAKSPGMHVDPEFMEQARVKNVKLGPDGEVVGMDVEPREWPPRGESF